MGKKIRVAIVGGSGYTGGELLRLLVRHPSVRVALATSEREAGKQAAESHPFLRGFVAIEFVKADPAAVARSADLAFLALPHGESFKMARPLLKAGLKVVDLSADFRLKDPRTYRRWYDTTHGDPDLLLEAVYGLTEFRRKETAKARLVANPGCYPTAALLGLLPFLESGVAAPGSVIVDAKSGVSGAGRTPSAAAHYPETTEAFGPYKVGSHRHTPEIAQEAASAVGRRVPVRFVPHLVPMSRGILAAVYFRTKRSADDEALRSVLVRRYGHEPFVRVLPPGRFPNTRDVRGTNLADVQVKVFEGGRDAVVLVAIDNLGKGAAGQAIQNMNVMMGFPETSGLDFPGVVP